jgi:hypothetical protein
MFLLTEQPLTSNLAALLPAGAHKLLNVARIEPGATQKRYMELTGYGERSIRSFTTALVDAGLAIRIQPGAAPLSEAEQAMLERLQAFGVTSVAAERLARVHTGEQVSAALAYVQNMRPRNPSAYLVWCLDNPGQWQPATCAPVVDFIDSSTMAAMNAMEPSADSVDEVLGSSVEDDPWTCPDCQRSIAMCICASAAESVVRSNEAPWWYALIDQLEIQLGKPTFRTWVATLKLIGLEHRESCDVYSVRAPDRYSIDWIEKHLRHFMISSLQKLHGKPIELALVL